MQLAYVRPIVSGVYEIKYLLANRIFMSFLFDQSLLDSQGDWVWGRWQWPLCPSPSYLFCRSREMASHVLAIRFYNSAWEAAFDSHLHPLIAPFPCKDM